MKDYYSLFVELSLQTCTKNDYADKQKVKKNNTAFKKLNKLQDEMKQNVNEEIWCALLDHEDDRVKVNAAAFCLQSKILVEQATFALEKVIDVSDDWSICLSAEMLLKIYK